MSYCWRSFSIDRMCWCQNSFFWHQSMQADTCCSVMPSLSISSRAASFHRLVMFGRREPLATMRSASCWQRRSTSGLGGSEAFGFDLSLLTTESRSRTSGISGAADFAEVGLTCGSSGGSGRFCRAAIFAGPADFAGRSGKYCRRANRRTPLRTVSADSSPSASRSLTAMRRARSERRLLASSSATFISVFPSFPHSSAIASRTISDPFEAREFSQTHSVAPLVIHAFPSPSSHPANP